MKASPINLIVFLLATTFLLTFGCVDDAGNTINLPFTESQFFSRVTDLNYFDFKNGDFNGMCILVDGNKLTAGSCSGATSFNWSDIVGFPSPCGAGEAVQIINSTLTCIPVGGSGFDTNAWTAGIISDQNVFQIDLNTIGNLKADGGYLCNDTNCYLISDLNIEGSGGTGTNYWQTDGTTLSPSGAETGVTVTGTVTGDTLTDGVVNISNGTYTYSTNDASTTHVFDVGNANSSGSTDAVFRNDQGNGYFTWGIGGSGAGYPASAYFLTGQNPFYFQSGANDSSNAGYQFFSGGTKWIDVNSTGDIKLSKLTADGCVQTSGGDGTLSVGSCGGASLWQTDGTTLSPTGAETGLTMSGTIQGGTLSDGTCSITGGVLTGCSGITEADTLQSVTDRGAVTTNTITISNDSANALTLGTGTNYRIGYPIGINFNMDSGSIDGDFQYGEIISLGDGVAGFWFNRPIKSSVNGYDSLNVNTRQLLGDWNTGLNGEYSVCNSSGNCGGTGTFTDTNWETSWTTFDANMKATYNLPALNNFDINALVLQIKSDGNRVVWKQTSNTDSARGTVLLSAIATAQNGDNFYLTSNTFDLGNNYIDLNIGSTGSINLHGSGKYSTIIKSSYVLKAGSTFYGQIIRPATNSETTDMTIQCTDNTNFQAGWGAYKTTNAVNALLKNVYISCGTDGVYNYAYGTSVLENIVDSTIVTQWDNVNSFNYVGGKTTVNVFDSNFVSTGGSPVAGGSNINSMVTNDANTTYNLFNTFHKCSGGTSINTGLLTLLGGTINFYSGTIQTSGTTTYDLRIITSGTINVGVGADFNTQKVSGTINYLDANRVARALITLPSASALTYFRGDGTWQIVSTLDTNAWTAGIINDSNIFQIDLNTIGNLRADGNYICASETCYYIPDLNNVAVAGSGFVNPAIVDLNMNKYDIIQIDELKSRVQEPIATNYDLNLTATSSRVNFGDRLNYERNTPRSIHFLIKTTDTETNNVYSRFLQSGAYTGWAVNIENGAIVLYYINNIATNVLKVRTDTGLVTDGAWHQVIITYAGDSNALTTHIYVDGQDKALTVLNNTLSASMLVASQTLYVGAVSGTAPIAQIDEVADWNGRVITPSEVTTLYNGGNFTYITNADWNTLGFLLHADEGTGTTATDTINSWAGTLTTVSWGLGVTFTAPMVNTNILKIENGMTAGEGGIITLGDSTNTPRIVIDGLTTRFNIAGTEKGLLNSTGLTWVDNYKTWWGTGSDFSAYYDGTNAYLNPREVGTGQLRILGDVNTGTFSTITKDLNATNQINIGNKGYMYDDGTYLIIGRRT